jgi:hypothetical protein
VAALIRGSQREIFGVRSAIQRDFGLNRFFVRLHLAERPVILDFSRRQLHRFDNDAVRTLDGKMDSVPVQGVASENGK